MTGRPTARILLLLLVALLSLGMSFRGALAQEEEGTDAEPQAPEVSGDDSGDSGDEDESSAPEPPRALPSGPAGLRRVSGGGAETKIEQALMGLAAQSGVSITPMGKAPGVRVTFRAEDTPLEQVLDSICKPKGWEWWSDKEGNYYVADRDYYVANVLPTKMVTKTFSPNHIKAADVKKAIDPLLEGQGSATADERTNKLFITALPQVIERIERLIRELDLQLVTRVFYLRHADVEDVSEKIETYKSGPGTIEVDAKTHQIIVTDLLANIKKMELLIDILDVGPEIVIYDINNIGIEGDDLSELEDIVESIRTKDLLFKVNDKQGVMILEDVPEVHEKVEQILEGFDKPTKQVLVQAELLSTVFKRQFDFGLDSFAYSGDLFDAKRGGVAPNYVPGDGAKSDLGFKNLEETFPVIGATGSGISGAYLSKYVWAQYSAAYSNIDTKVLLQPRLLIKNQQAARTFVGTEEPYLTTYFNDNGNGNNNTSRSTTQNTITTGLTFDVTPSISNTYMVEMDIKVSNDDAEPRTVLSDGEPNTLLARKRQNVETILSIPSGQTRVIGGALGNRGINEDGGLPFLSSLPVIGALFGKQKRSTEKANLLVFLTPSIVEETPPRLGVNGRRGRAVTDYEKGADLGLAPMDDDTTATKPSAAELDGRADSEAGIRELVKDYSPRTGETGKTRDSSFDPATLGFGKGAVIGGGESGGGKAGKAPPVAGGTPGAISGPARRKPGRGGALGTGGGKKGGGVAEPAEPSSGGNPFGGTPSIETKY